MHHGAQAQQSGKSKIRWQNQQHEVLKVHQQPHATGPYRTDSQGRVTVFSTASPKALWQLLMAHKRLPLTKSPLPIETMGSCPVHSLYQSFATVRVLHTSDVHTCTGVHPYGAPSLMPECCTCHVCVTSSTAMSKAKTFALHTTSTACVCIESNSCGRSWCRW